MFREANWEDRKKVYELICDLEQKELPYEPFSQIYQEQLGSSQFCCLVCEKNHEVIAVLNMRMEGQLHHADRIAEILEFSINPDFRNQGIGKEMFGFACDLAREKGCSQIELSSNQLRRDAHRFYLREGMHNFHFKFSMPFNGADSDDNMIGR